MAFLPLNDNIVSVHLKEIQAKQADDRDVKKKIKANQSHFQKTAIEQVKIDTSKNRIFVPKELRTRLMK